MMITDALPEGFDRLLRGALDVHVHGQPDVSAGLHNRGDDAGVARLAHAYGMAGWVLKSHLWATTDRARVLREQMAETGFVVHGSITLNPPAGGLEPSVVELAADHGASVVFLPTWGNATDVARDGYIAKLLRQASPAFAEYSVRHAISLLDGNGSLSGATRAVIDVCRSRGLALATGHASLAESRAIAAYCADVGQRLLITHPLHYTTDPAQLRDLRDTGAFLEFCNAPLVHPEGHLTVRDVHDALVAVGPERTILTTDVFSRWVPPEPECLRMFLEQLAYLGWTAEQISTMVAANPRTFLGEPA
jgi:uncharacterized protein DUF6282